MRKSIEEKILKGSAMRSMRKLLGMTQDEASLIVGMPQDRYNRLENYGIGYTDERYNALEKVFLEWNDKYIKRLKYELEYIEHNKDNPNLIFDLLFGKNSNT